MPSFYVTGLATAFENRVTSWHGSGADFGRAFVRMNRIGRRDLEISSRARMLLCWPSTPKRWSITDALSIACTRMCRSFDSMRWQVEA